MQTINLIHMFVVLILLYLIHFMKSEAILVSTFKKITQNGKHNFSAFQCFKALFVNVQSIYDVLTLYKVFMMY